MFKGVFGRAKPAQKPGLDMVEAVEVALRQAHAANPIDRDLCHGLLAALTRLKALHAYDDLLRLVKEAQNMGEIGDIHPDMEDDGLGWKAWAIEVRDLLAKLGEQPL